MSVYSYCQDDAFWHDNQIIVNICTKFAFSICYLVKKKISGTILAS